MARSLIETYHALADQGQLRRDPAQELALPLLDDIRAHLEAAPAPRRGLLGGLFHRSAEVPQGLYLWGGVGRGKSMLMDLFVENLAIEGKRRVHFHAFMQEVHERLHEARAQGAQDAILPVAKGLAQGLRLLALDEMQITDIADAMVVGRLFAQLFEEGVVVVTTSNRPPEGLYENGLNRQLFEPFIALIRERMVVHELASPTDYRQRRLAGREVWFTPLGRAADEATEAAWQELTGGEGAPLDLSVKGRLVRLPAFASGVARASFHDLCAQPLGPADYLAIAQAVRVLILERIPRLSRQNFNEARRFVTLIDALYEARVRLIASAADAPELLYVEGDGAFEFERTASRLREMQSARWLKAPPPPPPGTQGAQGLPGAGG